MKKTTNNVNRGIGFTGALTILFIALKLLNKIDWSWVWVLSPIWIQLAVTLVIGAVVTMILYLKD